MAEVAVVRTYLEMDSPDRLTGRASLPPGFVVRQEACGPDLYRELYEGVGSDYYWRDRRTWSDEQLRAHLGRPEIAIWVLRRGDTPLGFFELAKHHDGSVEIAYFGLMPAGIGHGLGRALLTTAVDAAWRSAPRPARVWLHTCTLDHPAALANYLARGFQVTHTERYTVDLSHPPPGQGTDAPSSPT
jgi:ribosomal protein S18 acetylase RimI-like enzyme